LRVGRDGCQHDQAHGTGHQGHDQGVDGHLFGFAVRELLSSHRYYEIPIQHDLLDLLGRYYLPFRIHCTTNELSGGWQVSIVSNRERQSRTPMP
jgi:hypothetical protein